MPTVTIMGKGRVTIPREIRDALGLGAGDRISFVLREDGVVELRPEKVDLMSLCGVLKPSIQGVTLEDMEEAIRQGATGG